MLYKNIFFNSYVLLMGIFFFTKEWIIINQELMVILGFITIFFTLKYFLEITITEALNEYISEIREKFINYLNHVLQVIQKQNAVVQIQTHTFERLAVYYHVIIAVTLLKFNSVIANLLHNANEKSVIRQKYIIQRIFQQKRTFYTRLFRPIIDLNVVKELLERTITDAKKSHRKKNKKQ